ncbi:MAG: methionyl-tRNA formyltransferase [Novosphingobium sp.]|nr:methionyl-tRNA formyltransferase [Novosphingobium sp.]
MRIIFMGTPDFAVPALQALHDAGHDIVAVYTQPPRPGGRRGKELTPTPVHRAAEALGLEVRHPASLKGADEQVAFAALAADVAVVAAYGLILPQAILDAPKLGCINLHASLLPRWRGAAPIQRAILAGDEETGITVMQMDAGLDTGAMLHVKKTWIGNDTAGTVTDRLSELGSKAIVEVLADLESYPPVAQPEEGVTYAKKIDKAEALLDFTRSPIELARQVRAFNPAPGAYFKIGGERIKVLSASVLNREMSEENMPGTLVDRVYSTTGVALSIPLRPFRALAVSCSEGYLRLHLVQRAGKKAVSAEEFLRGNADLIGLTAEP